MRNVPLEFYCSDFKRAKETAEIIGKLINQPPTAHKALRELNNGIAANKTKEEFAALFVSVDVWKKQILKFVFV